MLGVLLAGSSLHAKTLASRNLLIFQAYGVEETKAVDFDREGNVLGYYTRGFASTRGFIRDKHGRYKEFLDPLTGRRNVHPAGMNNKGMVIGNSIGAWLHDTRNASTVEIRYPGAAVTVVNDINDDGTIVGSFSYSPQSDGHFRQAGFIWKNGEFQVVETGGVDYTSLISINGRGDVGGKSGHDGINYSGFILDFNGNRTEITARINGDPMLPKVLDDNGDFATSCYVAEDTINVCMYRAATGEILQYEAPCYSLASPTSMKDGAISGSCFGAFGGGAGFIVRKSVAFPE